MLNQSNRGSGKAPQYEFGSVRLFFNPHELSYQAPNPRRQNGTDVESKDTVSESTVPARSVTVTCERAIQALRDIRHLLPADGVAIVDTVLDHVT